MVWQIDRYNKARKLQGRQEPNLMGCFACLVVCLFSVSLFVAVFLCVFFFLSSFVSVVVFFKEKNKFNLRNSL